MATVERADVPFKEAIEYHRRKVSLPTAAWTDLYGAAHARAFTVAGAARDDLLADLRTAVTKAIEQGTSFAEFQADFDALVERHGWAYKGPRDWRTRLIYGVNIRQAYQAGRWQQLMDPDIVRMRPHLRYRHGDSRVPRPLHLSWDGRIVSRDDPWIMSHYPANGWGCTCWVEAITERQLQRLLKAGVAEIGAPDDGTYNWTDPRTGESRQIPKGIDPGWDYNVGQASMQGVVPVELQEPLPAYGEPSPLPPDLPPLPPVRPVDPARILPDGLDPQEYVDRFLAEFGAAPGQPRDYRDASGGILAISEELFHVRGAGAAVEGLKSDKNNRGRYMLALADAIRDPDEIWADWALIEGGKPVLRRTYLRRTALGKREMFVRFQWTGAGWHGITAFDTRESYLRRYRAGALLYRRPEQ
ncbi:PBECR2 nuclease fold domain-containing protein [Tistrella mobilis]|uniref:PBECR2 nuclease fold domain-containing protein n=1 Tax=Tistrella mobilis TaxID=171437 RepID=UPI00355889E3